MIVLTQQHCRKAVMLWWKDDGSFCEKGGNPASSVKDYYMLLLYFVR